MTIYFDSSALVRLVQREAGSAALERYVLERYVKAHSSQQHASSTLIRTEVVRAVAVHGPSAIADARLLISRIAQLAMTEEVLNAAAELPTVPPLRSLEAIHLASARSIGTRLRAVVTYDVRMAAAAEALGLPVLAPS